METAEALAGHILYASVTLAARETKNTTTSTHSPSATSSSSANSTGRPPIYKVVGIILAVCSGLFIGVSFVIKKIGLLKANEKYHEEAGEGYGYLKNAWWWLGMTLMILGEICNFVAYAFTDAILVTPLGALSVVITTVLSAIFLKERLSFVGKVSCFICILGSVIIVLNAPEQAAVKDIQEMQHYVITPGFLSYAGVIIVGCLVVIFFVAPKYGKKSMLVYLSVCSLIGGLSVVATQGLGSAILAQINGESQFNKWFLYVLFVFVICTLLTEVIYLNKALNLFNAALVTPTYYVYFTSSTIVASAVLFQGFHGTATQIVDVVFGFLVICSGVVLLQLAKSSKDVPDTAVLKGDLDQVRTVAEQEEPEYEPRADTIRGGAGIVRAMSKVRTKRQAEEVRRLRTESLEPVGEGEEVEWDGLRRRKTVSTLGSGAPGSVKRTKTVHPPLGMSHFPSVEDDVSEPDSEVHPGFFGRIGRKSHTMGGSQSKRRAGVSPVALNKLEPEDAAERGDHTFGLPASLQKPSGAAHVDEHEEDTSYKGPGSSQHVHFTGDVHDRIPSRGSSSLAPPKPPPHGSNTLQTGHGSNANKRTFSFQNVFHPRRHRGDSQSETEDNRPTSRGALSFMSGHSGGGGGAKEHSYPGTTGDGATEEERAGLVHGDSTNQLQTIQSQQPPEYGQLTEEPESSDEWQVTPPGTSDGRSPPGLDTGSADLGRQRRRDDGYGGRDDGYGREEEEEEGEFFDEPLQTPISREYGDRSGRGAFM